MKIKKHLKPPPSDDTVTPWEHQPLLENDSKPRGTIPWCQRFYGHI